MVNFVYGYKPTSRLDSKLLAVDSVARTITDADIKMQMIVDFLPVRESNCFKQYVLSMCFLTLYSSVRHVPAWVPGMHFFEDNNDNLENAADVIAEWTTKTFAS